MSLAGDFWSRVDVGDADACWQWQGYRTQNGYGRSASAGRQWYAHRRAYELVKGAIPEGLEVDHLCRNRLCVNPAHLEAVTPAENLRRARVANLMPAERIIASLARWATEHGRSPQSDDWHQETPARRTVYRRFGSWDAALEAAGLPIPNRYPRGTHCHRGHAFVERRGRNHCPTCLSESRRAYKRRARAADARGAPDWRSRVSPASA